MDLLDRLSHLMKKANDTNASLARNTGVPYTTIDGLFKKGYKNAYISTIQKLCDYYHVSLDYLVNGVSGISDDAQIMASKYDLLDEHGKRLVEMLVNAEAERCAEPRPVMRLVKMPVYDDPAAAGEPLSAESGYEYVEFSAEAVPSSAEFGVRISGESMGETVPDGCVAFVRRAERADDGDVVIATLRGEGTVCKRLVTDGDRLLRLHSDNPDYPDITGDSLDELTIHGVVVGHT